MKTTNATPYAASKAAIPHASAFDSLGYGLAIWSPERRLVWCNRAYKEYFYHASAHLAEGTSFDQFLIDAARSGDVVPQPDIESWVERTALVFGQAGRAQHLLADGRIIEVVRDIDDVGNVLMTVTDISNMRRAEEALRRSKELAEAADQSKSRFLRAASHDLRQPLASLKILIFNCMAEQDPDRRTYILQAMDVSVAIMEDLLNALLQIGQLDAGRIVPNVTTFQASQLFDRLKVQFQPQADDKGLRLRIIKTSASVRTDRALLERILSNLVANALRYTRTGSVLVGCRRTRSGSRIEIWDTGPGIEAEHLGRIFDEFYQVATAREQRNRGLGLGLSIVKRLADILGHKVEVRSVPGKGSVFSVELPAGDVRQSDLGEPLISERIGGEFIDRSILLVEDDDSLREAARDLLERWGIDVHVASNLEKAKALVSEIGKVPHLIISDYSLRGDRGTDVVDAIRAHVGVHVPAIIMTADTDPALMESLAQRSFPVLVKPVSPPRLRVLMHNLLYEPSGQPK